METKQVATLVDYDLFKRSFRVRQWLWDHRNHTAIVLLVGNVTTGDYYGRAADSEVNPGESLDFEVIIRNSGRKDDLTFKTSAVCAVQDISNLIPVVAFDSSDDVKAMYDSAGVLVTYVF